MGKDSISRRIRQQKIRELVAQRRIPSQENLSRFLRQEGITVTQSTLSRDIREMGLVKVRGVYQLSQVFNGNPAPEVLRRSLRELVVDRGVSGNIVMVKTAPGNAHSLGVVLDAAGWPEILGTVAGDDTVFVLLRHPRVGRKVLSRIEGFLV